MNSLSIALGSGIRLWDAWNNLDHQLWEHILIAILVIGAVGLVIEKGMTLVANRFDYRTK